MLGENVSWTEGLSIGALGILGPRGEDLSAAEKTPLPPALESATVLSVNRMHLHLWHDTPSPVLHPNLLLLAGGTKVVLKVYWELG